MQLDLGVPTPPDPHLLARWRGMPFRGSRRCADCGVVTETAGMRRTSQRCLACFARARAPRRKRAQAP